MPALGQQLVRASQQLSIAIETDLDQREPVPADIVSALGKLTIFKMQQKAMVEIEQGRIEPAVNRLKTMATRLLDIGETELAHAALLEAGRLARTGSLSLCPRPGGSERRDKSGLERGHVWLGGDPRPRADR